MGGHITNAKAKSTNADRLVPYYKELKSFVGKYYPDVEIISINPIGLKGIFKDEYQKYKYSDKQNPKVFIF